MNVGALVATFLAAGVEWVEALTIVMAVGLTRGWRAALGGAGTALLLLLVLVGVIVLAAGGLARWIPLDVARAIIGLFLLLFGIRWLHKAVLRWAGLRAIHDEQIAFTKTRAELTEEGAGWTGFATALTGTFLEGVEVIFIVTALAGLGGPLSAAAGAILALVVVAAAGVAVRGPLSRVPENALKTVVGIMLTAFGTFFVGEGLGVHWLGGDWSLLLLIGAYTLATLVLVLLLRNPLPEVQENPVSTWVRTAVEEVWGLFVGEGPLALVTLAVVLAVGFLVARGAGVAKWAGLLLGLGIIFALVVGLGQSFGEARRRDRARRESAATAQEAGARQP
jgi:Ca2+/H+ antiporter, TMEM165/GDT1 family